jgi:hypothetical protein
MVKTRRRYTYHIDTKSMTSPKVVIAELDKLNSLLASTELQPISYFNRAYLIVTKQINSANQDGLFNDSKLMDKLEINFARQYFDALNHYVDHGELPGAWKRVTSGWFQQKHPASLSLLLGASAHINYDLANSLGAVIHKPSAFEGDYFKVNQLLMKSAPAISASYYESDKRINYIKKNYRKLYLKPVMKFILHWRTRVWNQKFGSR